jgi:hypothetical protein
MLVIILMTSLYYLSPKSDQTLATFNRGFGVLFLLFIVFYMGLRPISSEYFGDMGTYVRNFQAILSSGISPSIGEGEWVFSNYMYFCGLFMNAENWFLLTAALYVGLAALAFLLVHKEKTFIVLLMCAASFSFWAYGVNGIRNGLATSLVLLGFACRDRKWLMAIFFCLAFGTHKSTIIPIAAFVLTIFYNKPRHYLIGYGLAIILSLAMGGWWEGFFAGLELVEDQRMAIYLTNINSTDSSEIFSHVGFRWDFLFYSLWPIAIGYYYIFKKNYRDPFYLQLFNTYVVANAFWVMVIRANYSNRFAYLSWFMMSWVIIYPLLKEKLFPRQNAVIAYTLVAYFGFTYLMFLWKG